MKHKKLKCYYILYGALLISSILVVTSTGQISINRNDDGTPPEVTILNPKEGYLHFFGKPLMPNPFSFISDTMSLGGFRFKKVIATAHDDVDFQTDLVVKFHLNGEEQVIGSFVPCDLTWEWQWVGQGFGTYTLTVTAEDLSGNVGSAEIDVWYSCFIP